MICGTAAKCNTDDVIPCNQALPRTREYSDSKKRARHGCLQAVSDVSRTEHDNYRLQEY